MKNHNKNKLLSKSDLGSKSNKEVPKTIFRQELITWTYGKKGIKKTTLVRNFFEDKHIDSFISEPIMFDKDL